jgi:GNAT superfamily N-acetyltransferase
MTMHQTSPDLTPIQPSFELELTATPDPASRGAIARSMLNYNEALLGPPDTRPLAVLVRRDGATEVVGGLWGRTSYRWLFIEMVYLPTTLRGQRIGENMFVAAETEALKRGCVGAWLDTFSPAARRFYERQGYEQFGEIKDHPPGRAHFFMRKQFHRSSEPRGTRAG